MTKGQNIFKTGIQKLNSFLQLQGTSLPQENEKNIIIKGDSPEEVEQKHIELQQQHRTNKNHSKIYSSYKNKESQVENYRFYAYQDYVRMDTYDPLIGKALNIYASEATVSDETGKKLKIQSNSERIKYELEDLFYNRLNIDVNLYPWVRNLTKYGDNFLYIFSEKNKGVLSVKQLVNFNIEREEDFRHGKPVIMFKDKEEGTLYNTYEIAHFRLLANDRFIPYGTSVLSSSRRTWKTLLSAEDLQLQYRLKKTPNRFVHTIYAGNMDDDDVDAYVDDVINNIQKNPNIDWNTGQVDFNNREFTPDENMFVIKRNNEDPSDVRLLESANNANDVQDIEWWRNQLITGIGIPKPMLVYNDAKGEGKTLSMMDIRFAKEVNRIQQAMLMELNKIAIIHLAQKGYNLEETRNFQLVMPSASRTEEMLNIEILTSKASVYETLVRQPIDGGLPIMSSAKAKKLLFSIDDKEQLNDLQIIRFETAIRSELENTSQLITKTGIFDKLDARYGSEEGVPTTPEEDKLPGEGEEEELSPPNTNIKNPSDLEDTVTDLTQNESFNRLKRREVVFNNLLEEIKSLSLPTSNMTTTKDVIVEKEHKTYVNDLIFFDGETLINEEENQIDDFEVDVEGLVDNDN